MRRRGEGPGSPALPGAAINHPGKRTAVGSGRAGIAADVRKRPGQDFFFSSAAAGAMAELEEILVNR